MTVYRAASAQPIVDAARDRLTAHRMNPDTGRCVACGKCAPCPPSNAAFDKLVRYGAATAKEDYGSSRATRPASAPLLTMGALRRTILHRANGGRR
jgi:predicted molibdopterin-dependent oxidoreductase YjgC